MRQIIKNLGFSRIKRFLNPNHFVVNRDESSFYVDSNRSKCWTIKGSKSIKFVSSAKAKINIGGFYTENGDFYWYDLGIKKKTDSFLKSLIKFKKDIGRKIFLIMDRTLWHKSKKARKFSQKNKHLLQILFFSPATPDRNPTEYCWKMTREDLTSIKSFKNVKD